jgi:hypothetical protein
MMSEGERAALVAPRKGMVELKKHVTVVREKRRYKYPLLLTVS